MPEEKKPYIVDGQRVTLEEYRKTKYEDLRVRVPKGRKEEIKAFVATTGKSLNSFINEAIILYKLVDKANSPVDLI